MKKTLLPNNAGKRSGTDDRVTTQRMVLLHYVEQADVLYFQQWESILTIYLFIYWARIKKNMHYINHVLANNNSVLYNLSKLTVILSKSRKVNNNTQKHLP